MRSAGFPGVAPLAEMTAAGVILIRESTLRAASGHHHPERPKPASLLLLALIVVYTQ
jgi:hypothetical protein